MLVDGASVKPLILRNRSYNNVKGVNVQNSTSNNGEEFCKPVRPLLEQNAFITYTIGNRSNTPGLFVFFSKNEM